MNYRTKEGRERRFTIGAFPDWKTGAARIEAQDIKRRVDRGEDPLGEIKSLRDAPTIADLVERFEKEHLPKMRQSTIVEYRSIINRHILPGLRNRKVAGLSYSDMDDFHRGIPAPYRANRTVAVLSKMFALAIRWGWRADNPTKGIERNQETRRYRYLSLEELGRLTLALAEHPDQQAADIFRLLMLTGARRGEVLAARWDQLDIQAGVWTKPGSTTKQKTEHRVPLSAPARQLLADIRERPGGAAVHVFPGRGAVHRVDVKKNWAALCRAAKIENVRIHDLRHTYASVLASAGLSLPVIGALLGHTQPATTARYAHLFDDPLRAATERAGVILGSTGKTKADVLPIKGNR